MEAPSANTDPYALLGVPRTATTAEIERAYRAKSMQCHPDRFPTKTAEFQALRQAKELLLDPKQRQAHDAGGTGPGHVSVPPVQVEVSVSLRDVYHGGTVLVPVDVPQLGLVPAPAHIGGQGKLRHIGSKQTNLSVPVPRGAHSGQVVQLQHQGGSVVDRDGNTVGVRGDVHAILRVEEHPDFQRHGSHLITLRHISLGDALMGACIPIQLLDSTLLPVAYQPLDGAGDRPITPEDCLRRIKGHGLPSSSPTGLHGDLIVKFHIDFPKPWPPQNPGASDAHFVSNFHAAVSTFVDVVQAVLAADRLPTNPPGSATLTGMEAVNEEELMREAQIEVQNARDEVPMPGQGMPVACPQM